VANIYLSAVNIPLLVFIPTRWFPSAKTSSTSQLKRVSSFTRV
jgi:hypothetical protein